MCATSCSSTGWSNLLDAVKQLLLGLQTVYGLSRNDDVIRPTQVFTGQQGTQAAPVTAKVACTDWAT